MAKSQSVPDTEVTSNRESYTPTPHWVKVLGIVTVAVTLLIVAMMFVGGGEHGPGRHAISGDAPATAVTGDGGPGLALFEGNLR